MNLNQDRVPVTLEEALLLLKEAFNSKELNLIKKMARSTLHLSVGMHIRNEWSLWETDNALTVWFKKEYGVDHADDVSSIILECLINDLNNVPRRDKILAKEFKEHWEAHKKKLQ